MVLADLLTVGTMPQGAPTMTKKAAQQVKSSAAKRSLNATSRKPAAGAPFNDQDTKRRLGNFSGAGEHPRQGGRTTGIVGQNKKQNRTDQ